MLVVESILGFIATPASLTLDGFLGLYLKFVAMIVAMRAVFPSVVAVAEIGRPIQAVNFDFMKRQRYYGDCPAIDEAIVELKLNGNPDQGDRILVSYSDASGNPDINAKIAAVDDIRQSGSIVVIPPMGNEIPKGRWESELAANRDYLGCTRAEDEQYRDSSTYSFYDTTKIGPQVNALRDKYGFDPWSEWGNESITQNSRSNFDDPNLSIRSLCDFLESRCSSPEDKVEALMRLSAARKIINFVRIRNTTDEVANNISVRLSANAIIIPDEVVKAEGVDVVANTGTYAVLNIPNVAPRQARYFIVITKGKPITSETVELQSPITSKFNSKSLRWILVIAATLTLTVSILTLLKAP